MKYNLHINQKKIVDSKIKIDLADAVILDFMYSFSLSPKIEKKVTNNKLYCWFQYTHIMDNLPLLQLKKDSIYRRIKSLIELELLEPHPQNQQVGKSFFHITEKTFSFFFEQISPTDQNPTPPGSKSVPPPDQNPYNNSIIDNSSLTNVNDINASDLFGGEGVVKKVSTKKILLSESGLTASMFEKKLKGTTLAIANAAYYFECASDWSTSKNGKSADWIATIRNFIRRDYKTGTIVTGEYTPQQKLKGVADMMQNFDDI